MRAELRSQLARRHPTKHRFPDLAIPTHTRTLLHVPAEPKPTERACWRQIRFSRNGCWAVQGVLGKSKYLMDLSPLDTGKPLQELVYGCAFVKMLEEGGNLQASAMETPDAAQLGRVPVNGGAFTPVHSNSLASAYRVRREQERPKAGIASRLDIVRILRII